MVLFRICTACTHIVRSAVAEILTESGSIVARTRLEWRGNLPKDFELGIESSNLD